MITEELCATLTTEIEKTVEGGCRTFYFGGYGDFEMIDKSCFVIFYAKEDENSGAYKAFKYAIKQKDKMIINLFRE